MINKENEFRIPRFAKIGNCGNLFFKLIQNKLMFKGIIKKLD